MKSLYRLSQFCLLLLPAAMQAQLVINEFSASNKTTTYDQFGNAEDWIELYNPTNTTVNLNGWYLSDDVAEPTKWAFPAVSLAPGKHLLVFASDKNITSGGYLHTSFKLTQTKNEWVVLANPSGTIVDQVQTVLHTSRDHSYGRATDGSSTWAVFSQPTPNATNNIVTPYPLGYAFKPVMSQPAGFYYQPSLDIALSSFQNDGTLRYTTDGSTPSATSPAYTSPITIIKTTVIRARFFPNSAQQLPSFVETNTYFLNESHTVPVISVASEDYDELFATHGEIMTSFEFFETDHSRVFTMEGDMRGHGNDSWAFPQKGMRFYSRDQYGWDYTMHHKMFPTTDRDKFDVIILKAGASDNYPCAANSWGAHSCHIRDAFAHTVTEKNNLHLDFRRYRVSVVYLNGEYWGVYEMRERVDNDYADYYYDQPEPNVDMLKFWGGLNVENGSPDAWYALFDYVMANDMADPVKWDYVKSQVDIESFIDYFILNTYFVNSDWLNWNTMWWRGTKEPDIVKWKYALWDMDNTWNLGQNYTGLETTTYENDPCDVEDNFPNDPNIAHTGMWAKFFDNPEFVQMYINRYADLLNTTFTCDNLLSHLDSLVAGLEPEMPRQCERWGGDMDEWHENLNLMRAQIEGKCTLINNQIVDCYEDEGITGPYALDITVLPAGSGKVHVNTVTPDVYPFNATYFGGIVINLQALAAPDKVFDHWEVAGTSFGPDQFAEAIQFSLTGNAQVKAYFVDKVPCALPGNFTADSTFTSINLHWEGPNTSLAADLRWRAVGSTAWQSGITVGSSYIIGGLQPCTAYEIEVRVFCALGYSEYVGGIYHTDCSVDAEDLSADALALRAYPNPFTDMVQIEVALAGAREVTLKGYDATGKQVFEQGPVWMHSGVNLYPLEQLAAAPSGLYWIAAETGSGAQMLRVVKQ